MKFWILAFIMICVVKGNGQYVPDSVQTYSGPKNSVGLYLTTPLSFAMGADSRMKRFGLQYKRMIRPEKSMRISLVYDDVNDASDDMTDKLTDITEVTDSSVSYNWIMDYYNRVCLRYGYEWSNPNAKVSPVYGFDMMLGYAQSYDKRMQVDFLADTASYPEIKPDPTLMLGTRVYRDQTTRSVLLGVDFSVGWKFVIKDHWCFVAQMSPEIYVPVFFNTTYDSGLKQGYDVKSGGDFRWRVVEALLYYRF